MKKVLLTLLAVIMVFGLFAAAGFTGYRFGYARGVQEAGSGDTARPGLRPFDDFGPRGMPGHDFGMDRSFQRGFGGRGFPRMGFGFFSPLMLIGRLAGLALIIWFIYWLLTRSGWRFTRTVQTTETQPKPAETEAKEER